MNAPLAVADPYGVVVSETFTAPAAPDGVTAVTVVALTTTTEVAALPPTLTKFVPVRFVPVIVIAVPPVVRPTFGDTNPIVGCRK